MFDSIDLFSATGLFVDFLSPLLMLFVALALLVVFID